MNVFPSGLLPPLTPAEGTTQLSASELELRLHELRHRTKNLLAIFGAIVHQTLQDDISIAQAREVLSARLEAMGGAIDLLLSSAWEPVLLRNLIELAVTQHGKSATHLQVSGPHFLVGPDAALSLALAFHELETNAIKYGALSQAGGHVELRWETSRHGDEDCLEIVWQEVGGPAVTPPTHRGFGSRLASSLVGRRVGGQAKLEFLPTGVRWQLRAPLANMLR